MKEWIAIYRVSASATNNVESNVNVGSQSHREFIHGAMGEDGDTPLWTAVTNYLITGSKYSEFPTSMNIGKTLTFLGELPMGANGKGVQMWRGALPFGKTLLLCPPRLTTVKPWVRSNTSNRYITQIASDEGDESSAPTQINFIISELTWQLAPKAIV